MISILVPVYEITACKNAVVSTSFYRPIGAVSIGPKRELKSWTEKLPTAEEER
jgi:hypothetical protein